MEWGIAVFLVAAALFLVAFAGAIYVVYRFLSLVLSMEIGILKEFGNKSTAANQYAQNQQVTESKLKEFIKSRFSPSEGDFQPYTDEEAFITEQVENLRRQGLSDEELEAFVRQAVGTDIGKTED